MGNLIIQEKWEDMAKYAYIMLRHVPKSERFTLGAEVRSTIWKGLRLIILANHARKSANRVKYLLELDAQIKIMLALTRVAHNLEIIPTKKYQLLSKLLIEIGKMMGGWIKATKGQAR